MKFFTMFGFLLMFIFDHARSQDSSYMLQPNKPRYLKAYIIKTERHPAKGYLVTIQDSSVFLTPYTSKLPVNFVNAELAGLQQFRYQTIQKMKVFEPRKIGRTILISALVGVAVGAIIGYASGDDTGWFALTAGQKAVVGGVLGGCAGSLVGAIIGQGTTREFLINGEWKSLQEVKESFGSK